MSGWTWRQSVVGARWRGRTWRQNVASLAHVASGSQVASQDVASKCGVTCLRGVREPRAVAGALPALTRVALLGFAGRGVKMWHHLPTWRQGATWRRRTWRQNVASGAIDLRGVTGRGVKTWRHEARLPGTCLQNVSSIVGRYVHPHRRPPCVKRPIVSTERHSGVRKRLWFVFRGNIGHTYSCRVGSYGSNTCRTDFTGDYNFMVEEMETYYHSRPGHTWDADTLLARSSDQAQESRGEGQTLRSTACLERKMRCHQDDHRVSLGQVELQIGLVTSISHAKSSESNPLQKNSNPLLAQPSVFPQPTSAFQSLALYI